METYRKELAPKSARNSQPATSLDIITSASCLRSQSFMGSFSDEEIEDSIRRTRLQFKEIQFKRPSNFGK